MIKRCVKVIGGETRKNAGRKKKHWEGKYGKLTGKRSTGRPEGQFCETTENTGRRNMENTFKNIESNVEKMEGKGRKILRRQHWKKKLCQDTGRARR